MIFKTYCLILTSNNQINNLFSRILQGVNPPLKFNLYMYLLMSINTPKSPGRTPTSRKGTRCGKGGQQGHLIYC